MCSQDDNPGPPSKSLIDLVLRTAGVALDTDLPAVSARMPSAPFWPDYWPGEHYRLLAAFVRVLAPRIVIEIGTHTGLSALSLKRYLPDNAVLYTFDVVPWKQIPGTCLRDEDFHDGRLKQIVADLSQPDGFNEHRDKIASAPLMFIDGPKDKLFEPAFLSNLRRLTFSKPAYLVFDDIKDWNMLGVWRGIEAPKLDITSFGHWTGTGIVEWGTVTSATTGK